jgi:hypothetical protein
MMEWLAYRRLSTRGLIAAVRPLSVGRELLAQRRARQYSRLQPTSRGTRRERLTGRQESVSLPPLRSDLTCENGGEHSGFRPVSDTEEVTGSNPVAPTSKALTSGNADEAGPSTAPRGQESVYVWEEVCGVGIALMAIGSLTRTSLDGCTLPGSAHGGQSGRRALNCLGQRRAQGGPRRARPRRPRCCGCGMPRRGRPGAPRRCRQRQEMRIRRSPVGRQERTRPVGLGPWEL